MWFLGLIIATVLIVGGVEPNSGPQTEEEEKRKKKQGRCVREWRRTNVVWTY
jgi:hypothetical protein